MPMSWPAATLIITSAFLHALWNLISKRRSPTLAFFFVASISGTLVMLPLLVVWRAALAHVPSAVWGLVLATGGAQAVYFVGLAGAYRRGDMSLAYPLARALPVLAVAAISLLLGNRQQIGALSLAGMVLISGGCIILPLPGFGGWRLRHYADAVYLLAALAALGTTAYTLIDDAALRRLRGTQDLALSVTGSTLLFIALQMTSTALLLGVVTLGRAAERRRLRELVRDRALVRISLLTGLVIMATYGLVLAAMAYVRDVSYVAAFRQLSIPIGALLGLTLEREPRHRPKIVGILVITLGLILVAVG